MKKKVIAIIAIILVAIGITIFVRSKVNKSKINYDIASIDEYNYIKYRENGKFGVIDRDGNTIINAKYSNIEIPNPQKDVFICYEGEKGIALNSDNETLFSQYSSVQPIKLKNIASTLCYEKTVLKYQKDGLYGLINLDGKQITKNIYTSIENLQSTEGKLLVSKDGKNGVININGTVLVEPKFDNVESDGYYTDETKYIEAGFIVSNTTSEGYRYGYINYQGKEILGEEYNDIKRINDKKELYLIVAQKGQYGLYKDSKQLIKPEYQSISYTDNGGVIVERNKQYGIANLKGEVKVEPKYSQIEEDGIYLYARTSKENDVYDIAGNKKDINFNKKIYETENNDYKITTILNNDITYYGVENNNEEELIPNNYSYIEYIFDDYFIVETQKGKYGIMNSKGNNIIDFEYDLIQKIKNKNVVQALSKKSKELKIYSSDLENVVSMESAKMDNEKNYIKLSNKNETIYLDKNGNKIEESADIVQEDIKKELPQKIREYKKVQYSLDDVYYE